MLYILRRRDSIRISFETLIFAASDLGNMAWEILDNKLTTISLLHGLCDFFRGGWV